MSGYRVIVLVGLLTMITLLCGACGTHNQQTGPAISETAASKATASKSLDQVLAEIDAYEPPPEVDRALFERMRANMREAIVSRWQSKTASDLDEFEECNKVNDLKRSSPQCWPVKLKWSYRNGGDYDQGGIVGIEDITPVAIHYDEEVGDEVNTIRELIDEDD